MDINNFSEEDIDAIVNQLFANNSFLSVEDAYQQLAEKIYESFSQANQNDLVLSRVYHTFELPLLPDNLQETAKQIWEDKLKPNSKLVVLMGTYGQEPEWRSRKKSKGHRAILLSQETIGNIPMVAMLLQQIGIDVGAFISDNKQGSEFGGIRQTFGVFYVSPALGSPYIPAQDFVNQYDVKSVLGTGVMLPQGDISIYICFSRIEIQKEIAANIASLMSVFWQRAFTLLDQKGMFTEY